MTPFMETGFPFLAAGLLTGAAFVWDIRTWRIPNALTIPAFVLGIAYQAFFHGAEGLADAGLGFLLGFGTLLVLWLIGGGGGGDVKLMGALSVWLGVRLVFQILLVSVVLVWLLAIAALAAKWWKGKTAEDAEQLPAGTARTKEGRHVAAFGVMICLATWVILLVQVVKLQAAG